MFGKKNMDLVEAYKCFLTISSEKLVLKAVSEELRFHSFNTLRTAKRIKN
jgi:hypothetical protein